MRLEMAKVFLGAVEHHRDAQILERVVRLKTFVHWPSRSSRNRSGHMSDTEYAHRICVFSACTAGRLSCFFVSAKVCCDWRV
jgi:hypothetical protein